MQLKTTERKPQETPVVTDVDQGKKSGKQEAHEEYQDNQRRMHKEGNGEKIAKLHSLLNRRQSDSKPEKNKYI